MKVWKRVLEMLCGLNDLLCSSQASLIALFTHTTHADSIRMSVAVFSPEIENQVVQKRVWHKWYDHPQFN